MESTWPCNERERGLSSRRRCLPSYFATPIGHGLLGKACRGTHRAQLTFSSWNKVKALGKLDATNLAQVHHSIVRDRGEPLERSVVPFSSVDGFSSKPRAQLTFSSWNKVKAFGKLDATNLAQVHHSFVRAPREPLERSVVPCSSVDGFSSKPRAQLTFSS